MNLLLVDDHALFREGLRVLLANISPGVAIHESASIEGAIDECRDTKFRMVLLDLHLQSTEGLESLQAFRNSVAEIPVVVLSGDQEPRLIKGAIDRGAVGFVPKSHTSDQMIAALRLVLSGGIYLPPHVLQEDSSEHTAFARLSPRQWEVTERLLKGYSNKAIARDLKLSEGTVKAHVYNTFQIIGAKNRVEAVMIAARSGIKVM
ncbi:MAG: response regulator [Steroidobacteraceae bacterium]